MNVRKYANVWNDSIAFTSWKAWYEMCGNIEMLGMHGIPGMRGMTEIQGTDWNVWNTRKAWNV